MADTPERQAMTPTRTNATAGKTLERITKLLAIDPSSTCTGYAILHGRKLVECGKLAPNRTRDDANARIDAMLAALAEVANEHAPDVIVIEDTSGKVGKRHGGNGAGLPIYGKAVGEFRRFCIQAIGRERVAMVPENEWTRGVSKANRTRRIALEFTGKGYDPAQDKGGDVADAIGLGMYWAT